ncbi:hypothetical protein AB1Y20_014648 [Prymnesium parvum]|uniref:Uncharacterized protein n=1 Tax=Prymnesium parvum TaxID=97485 RepID=A0AB34IBF3_PRYPA
MDSFEAAMHCAVEMPPRKEDPPAHRTATRLAVLSTPPTTTSFRDSRAARFLPAVVVLMIWLYLVTYSHGPLDLRQRYNASSDAVPLGDLWHEYFEDYYPMTIAMIGGSLIAGSTPLGGGVVAFPVAVLIIGFTAAEGRDFTVLIQTIGMNAAGYLIVLTKAHLLDFTIVSAFIVFGVPGVLLGLSLNVSPFYIVLTFQVLVLEFAFVFFYLNILAPRDSPSAVPTHNGSADSPDTKPMRAGLAYGSMALAAFAGGFITSKVGSGSDIVLYAYGLLVWNMIVPESRRLSDTSLTASSVVVMGILSLVTSFCRAMTFDISSDVIFCWGATSWVVCIGAPMGSLFLTPGLRAQMRIAFYLLAVAQFVGFAVLRIKSGVTAWIIIGTSTVVVVSFLSFHAKLSLKSIRSRGNHPEKLSAETIKYRLLTV